MSEIEPALTAEEWARIIPSNKDGIWGSGYLTVEDKHGMAAHCLHDQPFGFTWEDVEHHRRLAGECGNSDGFSIDLLSQMEILSAWHLSMADRIQALLPPQDQ